MMRNGGLQLGFVALGIIALLGVGAGHSFAGPLYPGGLPHPLAITNFSGTVPLIHDPGNQHYGDVEYAVFTAANWITAFGAEDTPNLGVAAGETVYAYQVINAGTRGNISQFTAGLGDFAPHGDLTFDDELVGPGDQDFIAGAFQAPNISQVTPTAVRWIFDDGTPASNLNAGESSAILFYTSQYGPLWDNGSTTTGQGASRIPAPEVGVPGGGIPEPSTLLLASLCGVGFTAIGRRRGRG